MTKDIKVKLNGMLLERIEPLARHLFPGGKKRGRSWRVGSLDINLRTGMWGDWDGSTTSMSANLIDLWIYATNLKFETAISEIENWLGVQSTSAIPEVAPKEQSASTSSTRNIVLPLLEKPTRAELRQLSELRSISVPALEIAVQRGFLWTYRDKKEGRAWLITDSARKSAIARRLDGKLWECNGTKSKTLYGSWGNYPIGIADAGNCQAVGLTEGSPDFLALIDLALFFGTQVAPVCMAGVTMTIPESQLPLFRDKRVRIFIHDDEPGIRAAKKWNDQLSEVARVDGYLCGEGLKKVDGADVEDLNDLCRINSTSWIENREDIECLMDFACSGAWHEEAVCLA